GTKRIGLAIAQTLTCQANPLKVLPNNQAFWPELRKTIKEWQIKKIIIGLPLNMDGEEQEITRQVKNFGKKVTKEYGLPVFFNDERLSSFEAERHFQQQRAEKLSKAKNKHQIDAVAAQIILQSWLDQH
ncbi:MAG: Holliday junction resolvase RuvX, partial [Xanthomonadales bacterium]|nr:Holliday junction resolvase RuvX [Xanthomonadales bacterium]